MIKWSKAPGSRNFDSAWTIVTKRNPYVRSLSIEKQEFGIPSALVTGNDGNGEHDQRWGLFFSPVAVPFST
jgi:hypothetical protein